jgi:NAD+ synthase (glutamine-hydrolysing)
VRLVKVAAATLNQTPLDWERNRANVLDAIAECRANGVGILCLPELCITGYGCEDAFLSPAVLVTAADVLLELVSHTTGLIVCFGLPVLHNKATYNASCLAANGQILGFVAKRALAGDGIHYEPRWFKPWPRGKRTRLELGHRSFPIGDVYFDCGGIKIGFEICEDAWIAERPGVELALEAVDVILNPSASHFAFGKRDIRRRLVLEGSRAFGVTYVYANLLGNEAGRAIYDGDALIASGGELVASARRFSFARHGLITAVVDVDRTRTRHAALSSFEPHVTSDHDACIAAPHEYPRTEPETTRLELEAWESSTELRYEEFARALPLALHDYRRKSRASGFVVSLSGGADSAAVACLTALSVRFGAAEIGLDAFAADMPGPISDERALVSRLLTTVYQATKHSSEVTRQAARDVAEAVGARHIELDVDAIVEQYIGLIGTAIGRKLDWEHDDITLQNIQARARAPGVWMLANIENKLLLATSNRSEAAVGYATMDGDTAGGLSPIAGIDKAFLLRWLQWLETKGPLGIGPMPALASITRQAPTAELRPQAAVQTDEADLMPYVLLDAIERAAIRDKQSPLEVFQLMRVAFPTYDKPQLAHWIERFFRLWSRNQWKRERYAPSFHIDDSNLDPKTACRFPILSGGFERELAELRRAVDAG